MQPEAGSRMSGLPPKKVDESWKEQVEQERQRAAAGQAPPPSGPAAQEPPEVRFDVFLSSLAMDALISLGDIPHPTTKKQNTNLPQAKYLIDLLGVLEEKTKGNLSVDEERLLKDTLYQLRMRYLAKAGTG
jgi:hypothetical protein